MNSKIDPSSQVQTKKIAENSIIWQYVVILPEATIGVNCNINCHCFIENDVIIGDNVTVKSGVYLWDGLRIEDDVFIGPNVTFVNDRYPRSKNYPDKFLKTVISKGATIGANATILGGIVIGEYSMIGAGSVVTRSVQNNSLWFGNPARFKGFICECGTSLKGNLQCPECKKSYSLMNESTIKLNKQDE